MPVVVAAPDGPTLDHLVDAIRAIDAARSLSDVLDALTDRAGAAGARAAVWIARGADLRGWRSTSSPDVPDIVARARSARAIERDDRSLALPLEIAGEVVAVLSVDSAQDGRAVETLARHAAKALESMVAIKTARYVTAPLDTAAAPGLEGDDADSSARRYAKLLVSEIKLYHEPEVVAGRRERDLSTRLGGEIARARVLYEQRVPATVRQRSNYFQDELVRTLANGDPTLLSLT